MNGYLNRSKVITSLAHRECGNDGYDLAVEQCIEVVKRIPAAEVVEVREIGNAVDESLRILDAIRSSGRMGYDDYSELYYAISDIIPDYSKEEGQ